MLNRRILRIKAMQSLYSYYLLKQSLIDLRMEELLDKYALDPAEHDFNDSKIFADRQKEIQIVFKDSFQSGSIKNSLNLGEDIVEDINTSLQRAHREISNEKKSNPNFNEKV